MKSVLEFGAVGSGVVKDTAAIQRALDSGGIVNFPPGIYLTGSLYLRSHGGICLEAGAVLKASPDPADYNAPDFCPQNTASTVEKTSGAHLLIAVEQQDITIDGDGVIDGSREAFFDPEKGSRDEFTGWRPSQMLYFCECRDVRLRNVALINSPYWACLFHGCEHVRIQGVTVRNHPKVWNGDGIDIDSCRKVTVSDCDIQSSDDSLTVRAAGQGRLRHAPCLSEQITVTNCLLSSGQAAVRLGVGTGIIRDCVFSNITMDGCQYGIVLVTTFWPDQFPGGAPGVEIHDILFENMIIRAEMPFYLTDTWKGPPRQQSNDIRNITFRSIHAFGSRTNVLQGDSRCSTKNLLFSDVRLTVAGGGQIQPDLPEYRGDNVYKRPCAWYIVNTKQVYFRNCTCLWETASCSWRQTFLLDHNFALEMDHCDWRAPDGGMTGL